MSEAPTEGLQIDPATLPSLVDYYRNKSVSLELEFVNYQIVSQQEIARLKQELADAESRPAKSADKRTTG